MTESRAVAKAILRQVAAELHAGRQIGRMPHVVGRTLLAVLARLDGPSGGMQGSDGPGA